MSNLLVRPDPGWAQRSMIWLAQVAADATVTDLALRVALLIAWRVPADGNSLAFAQVSYRALMRVSGLGRTAIRDACKALVERHHLAVQKCGTTARQPTIYRLEVHKCPFKSRGGRRPSQVDVVTPFGRLTVAAAPLPAPERPPGGARPHRAAAAAPSQPNRAAAAAPSIAPLSPAELRAMDRDHEQALEDNRARRARQRAYEQERAEIGAAINAIRTKNRTGARTTSTMKAAAQEAERRARRETGDHAPGGWPADEEQG